MRSLGTGVSYNNKFSFCRGLLKTTKTKNIQGMISYYFRLLQMVDSLGIPHLWPPAEVLSLTLKQPAKLIPLKALMMPFYAVFQLLLYFFFLFSHTQVGIEWIIWEYCWERISDDWEVRKRTCPRDVSCLTSSILIWYWVQCHMK